MPAVQYPKSCRQYSTRGENHAGSTVLYLEIMPAVQYLEIMPAVQYCTWKSCRQYSTRVPVAQWPYFAFG
jgi:hypothetical protein